MHDLNSKVDKEELNWFLAGDSLLYQKIMKGLDSRQVGSPSRLNTVEDDENYQTNERFVTGS